jgi:hypothetical protein
MIDDLKPQDVLFLKHIKNKTMDKFSLPIQCVCLEFMNDDYFRLIFAMKMFPFEVYFHRYEIIDNLYDWITLQKVGTAQAEDEATTAAINKAIFFIEEAFNYEL